MTVAHNIDRVDEVGPAVLEGVSWDTYESYLRDLEESGQHKRVTYDRGRMVIVSPLPKHEKWKSLLGRFVECIADELRIPISTYGSATWKAKDKGRGLEADECFYIQHEAQVRGKLEIDLRKDPPPDLCIEIDLSRSPSEKLEVYAALGIREIWHFDGKRLEMLVLQEDEAYAAVDASLALPRVTPGAMKRFMDRFGETDQNALLRLVREWRVR